MAVESANPDVANPGEWLERKVLPNGVWVHEVRYYPDELMKLRQGRRSLRVAVRLEKPDASQFLCGCHGEGPLFRFQRFRLWLCVPRKKTVRNSHKRLSAFAYLLVVRVLPSSLFAAHFLHYPVARVGNPFN
jgi:hypothetical protein